MTGPAAPLPERRPDGILRRCDASLYAPIEHRFDDLLGEVEALGADPRLTDAVVLLQRAKAKVSDWLELDEGSAQHERA